MSIVSGVTYAGTRPFSFASGRHGQVYGVNGLTRGVRWDGVTLEPIGLTSAPSVSITTSATVLYYVANVSVVRAGENYVSDPTVTIAGVTGPKATIAGGGVAEISIVESATTHTTAPYVAIDGGQVSHGTVGVTTIGSLAGIAVKNVSLAYYTEAPQITITATTPTQTLRDAAAVGVLNFRRLTATSGTLDSIIITDPGEFLIPPNNSLNITATAPSGMPAGSTTANASAPTLTPLFSGYAASATANGGTEYLTPPEAIVKRPGKGTGAFIALSISNGSLSSADVVSPGAGYGSPITATPSSPKAVAKANMQPRLSGVYLCGIRFIDDTPESKGGPVAGSMSPLVEIDCTPGTGSLTWNLPTSPSDGTPNKIAKVELWRSTADQFTTLYKVTEFAVGSIPSTYVDDLPDFLLVKGTLGRDTLFVDSAKITNSGSGYSSAPTVSVSGGNPDTAASLTASLNETGNVASISVVSSGSGYQSAPTLTFSGGGGSKASATAVMRRLWAPDAEEQLDVLPIITADGYPSAYRQGIPPSNMSVICMFGDRAWYAVDTSGNEPNTIYFSEIDEPESVPDEYQIIVQQAGREPDAVSGLIPFASALYVAQSKRLHRLTYGGNPLSNASLSYVAQRGLVNDRCWDFLEGTAYLVDYSGLYAFAGQQVDPISDPVSTYWSQGGIDFSKSDWFFVRCDERERVVRFYYAPSGSSSAYPTAALCYSTITKAWWQETYAHPVSAACTLRVAGEPATVLGGATQLLQTSTGFTDLGQAIPCTLRTGAFPLSGDGRRGLRVTYTPTANTASLDAAFYYNNSTSAKPNAAYSDLGSGFIAQSGTIHTLDMRSGRSPLGAANGYAQVWLSGRNSDHSAGGDRHVAVELLASQTASQAILHRIEVEGAG